MNRLPFAIALAAFSLLMLMGPSSTSAELTSPTANCEVRFNGVSAKDIASHVPGDQKPLWLEPNATIAVDVITEHRILHYNFSFDYGPITFPIYNGIARPDSDPMRDSFTMESSRYTQYGTGLYTVTGNILMADSSGHRHECDVVVLIHVDGNPFTTVAGVAALATALGGMAGIIQGVVGAVMDSKEVVDSIKDLRQFYKLARTYK